MKTIVAFHIGRGGRFNNQGFRSFKGTCKGIFEFENNNTFTRNRDKKGRFCKEYIVDCNGNIIIESKDMDLYHKGIGILEFDGPFDTTYTCYLEDCCEEEIELIVNSSQWNTHQLIIELEKLGIY